MEAQSIKTNPGETTEEMDLRHNSRRWEEFRREKRSPAQDWEAWKIRGEANIQQWKDEG